MRAGRHLARHRRHAVLLTLGTALVAVPLGDGRRRSTWPSTPPTIAWTRSIRVAIINLAGIPSVVYGLFGLGFFVHLLPVGHQHPGRLPDAGDHDPAGDHHDRGGSAARGAQQLPTCQHLPGRHRWQTIRRIVLPQALPGILTGVILGAGARGGRDGARSCSPPPPSSCRACRPRRSTRPWPCPITCSSSPPRCPGCRSGVQYGTAVVLLVFVLVMNVIATVIRSRAPRPPALVGSRVPRRCPARSSPSSLCRRRARPRSSSST